MRIFAKLTIVDNEENKNICIADRNGYHADFAFIDFLRMPI